MSLSFLKKGAESASLAKKAAVEAEIRKESQGKLFRFFLKPKEEAKITFVDGDLDKDGYLLPPRWYEHMIFLNGTWNNFFLCPEKTFTPDSELYGKCPNCETNDNPSLVAAFTIIDHRTHTSAKGIKYVDTRKLLIAKPKTFELLNKLAVKRGGLAGCTFDVSRGVDKDPAVGSLFDFSEKRDIALLKKTYTRSYKDPKTNEDKVVENFVPANYDTEIVYRSANELRKLGLGAPGSSAAGAGESTTVDLPAHDYSDVL